MKQRTKDEKAHILIDCRNQNEFAIGHFKSATYSKSKTFEQFPTLVHKKQFLKDHPIYTYIAPEGFGAKKQVLMLEMRYTMKIQKTMQLILSKV